MLNSLLLALPILAGVEAAGGDHYAQFRNKDPLRPVKRSPIPAGGDHYAQFHNKGEFIAVRDHIEDGKRYFYPGEIIGYDERGLPITATTTIVVPMTTTQTIWVDPTGVSSSDATSVPLPTITGNDTALPSPSAEANATSALPTSYPSANETLPSPTGGDNSTSALPTELPSDNSTEPSPSSNATSSSLPTLYPSGNEREPSVSANATSVLPTTLPSGNETEPSLSANATSVLPTVLPSGNETEPSLSANATSVLPTTLPSGNETEPSVSVSANATSVLPTVLPSGNETEPTASANATSVFPTTLPSGNETEPSASANATSALPTPLPSGNETDPSASANATSVLPTVLPSGNGTGPSASANATSVFPTALPSGNETEPSEPSISLNATSALPTAVPSGNSSEVFPSANATSILPSSVPSSNETEPSTYPNATSALPTSLPSSNGTEPSASGSVSEVLPTSSNDVPSSSAELPSSSVTASPSDNVTISSPSSSANLSTGTASSSSSLSSSASSSTEDAWITPGPSPSSTWWSYTGEPSATWWSYTGEPSSSARSSSSSSHYFSSTTSTSTWEEPAPTDGSPSSVVPTSIGHLSSSVLPSSSALPSSSELPSSSSSSIIPRPTGSTVERLMSGYWADWTASQLPPESIDWTKFDIVNYAFAEPDSQGTLQFSQSNGGDLLTRLTTSAHQHGKRVVLSVGGWTGSAHFSTIVSTASGRALFVKNCVAAVDKYNLDGIDLDWEYPGAAGASGNIVSPSDSANYLIFLKELRQALPSPTLITAATQVWPFYGSNGQPLSDVSEFAAVFDWILIMNYDIWGSSSEPGPNAPLSDGCKNSSQPTANAYSAVASWTAAGMPAHKISLGVAAYGYIQKSHADHLYQRRSYPVSKRAVTIKNEDGGTSSGQINFSSIVQQGALVKDGTGFIGAGGFIRHWDECSSTPWLKSEASGQIITYDDTQSLNLKGQFAAQAGLRGCSVWAMDGDLAGNPLIAAVRSGMGI